MHTTKMSNHWLENLWGACGVSFYQLWRILPQWHIWNKLCFPSAHSKWESACPWKRLWGFKRWASEEQKRSPFAFVSYGPVWKSVWEGPSTPRAGTREITMILFSWHSFRISLAKRRRGIKKREPLLFVYKRCHKFAETTNKRRCKKQSMYVQILHIRSSTNSFMGATFIFHVGAFKYV